MHIDGYCDERFAPVRAAFERNFAENGDLGAAVSIVFDGECVVDLWGGHVDADRARRWEPDTIVNVYSTTKGMVAVCAHLLADRGLLDLDAPVARYWPEFAQAGKGSIPVSMLLNHKAGLPGFEDWIELDELADWDRACARLAAQTPMWEPGTACGYHAVTYGFLVGEVIRRITGRSVGRFFADEVATPLGVADGFYIGVPVAEHPRIAPLVDPPGPRSVPLHESLPEFGRIALGNQSIDTAAANRATWRSAEIPGANGHGHARALAHIYGEVARGGVLSRSALDAARQPQNSGMNLCLGMELEWLLGFQGNSLEMFGPSSTAFGHSGMGGSSAFGDTDNRVGFAYTPNEIRVADLDLRGFSLKQAAYESLGLA